MPCRNTLAAHVEDLCVDQAWADGVHADIVPGQIQCQTVCRGVHSACNTDQMSPTQWRSNTPYTGSEGDAATILQSRQSLLHAEQRAPVAVVKQISLCLQVRLFDGAVIIK